MIELRVFRDGVADEQAIDSSKVKECLADAGAFVWFDAPEPTDEDIAELGAAFDLHPLTMEDIAHRRQRPRVELFEQYGFITLRPLTLSGDEVVEHEVHTVVGKRFMGTLRYGPQPFPVDDVANRLQRQPDLVKSDPGGFAVYALIDEVVDDYLTIVERFEDRADELEDVVFADDQTARGIGIQERLFRLKRGVVQAAPVRIAVAAGDRPAARRAGFRAVPLLPYYRDVTEHTLRVVELADNVRDVLDLVARAPDRAAREPPRTTVMKKLTAWAAIILVPTLIAGIYGMNFQDDARAPLAVGLPGRARSSWRVASTALYFMFKKRGWL